MQTISKPATIRHTYGNRSSRVFANSTNYGTGRNATLMWDQIKAQDSRREEQQQQRKKTEEEQVDDDDDEDEEDEDEDEEDGIVVSYSMSSIISVQTAGKPTIVNIKEEDEEETQQQQQSAPVIKNSNRWSHSSSGSLPRSRRITNLSQLSNQDEDCVNPQPRRSSSRSTLMTAVKRLSNTSSMSSSSGLSSPTSPGFRKKEETHHREPLSSRDHNIDQSSQDKNARGKSSSTTLSSSSSRPASLFRNMILSHSKENRISTEPKARVPANHFQVDNSSKRLTTSSSNSSIASTFFGSILGMGSTEPNGASSTQRRRPSHSGSINGRMSMITGTSRNRRISVPVANDNGLYEDQKIKVEQLLKLCSVNRVAEFGAHIEWLSLRYHLTKIGEATFSEVYSLVNKEDPSESLVIKVIPFASAARDKDDEQLLAVEDLEREVKIAAGMSKYPGFASLQGAHIVKGRYSRLLLKLWDDYYHNHNHDTKKQEEVNARPDFYSQSQLYCILTVENGGIDLESFPLQSWREAKEIFWQTCSILAHAEQEANFEHRDLHWGNLVISRSNDNNNNSNGVTQMMSRVSISDSCGGGGGGASGLKVKLIDFTLSRAEISGNKQVIFHKLEDCALFNGRGDYQFDIYRLMRSALIAKGGGSHSVDWSLFCPETNLLWIHYLLDKLMKSKGLSKKSSRKNKLTSQDIDAVKSLEHIYKLLDPRPATTTATKSTGTKRRLGKKQSVPIIPTTEPSFHSCAEFIHWAKGQGFI